MLSYIMERQQREQRLVDGEDTVKANRFDEAFEPYREAFILGDCHVRKLIINEFVSNLLAAESSKLSEERALHGTSVVEDNSLEELLTCSQCHELFHCPVTLACGHTFCLECVTNNQLQDRTVCPGCGQESCFHYTSNIVLRELSRMWFAEKTLIRSSIAEARKLLRERKMLEFMNMVNNLLSTYPDNVDLLLLRAHGFRCANSHREALKDLDLAYSLAEFDSNVLNARGEVLAANDQPEEATTMFLRATALSPNNPKYRCSLVSYLEKLLQSICDGSIPCRSNNHNSAGHKSTKPTKRVSKILLPRRSRKPYINEATAIMERNTATKRLVLGEPHVEYTSAQAYSINLNVKANESFGNEEDGSLHCQMEETVKTKEARSTCLQTTTESSQPKSNIPSELECKLCFNLMYEPVTTSCGHSLCRSCLRRCLDHRYECPCCRTNLQSYLEHLMMGNIGTCEVLEKILLLKFQDEYEKRKSCYDRELLEFSRFGIFFAYWAIKVKVHGNFRQWKTIPRKRKTTASAKETDYKKNDISS